MISGPVARSLFNPDIVVGENEVDQSLDIALKQEPSIWGFSLSSAAPATVTHRVFLIQPKEVVDDAGTHTPDRQSASVNFLTNYIGSRAAKAMDERLLNRRKILTEVFHTPCTRSAAGKLVESMLHRALINKSLDAQPAFSVNGVKQHLALLGEAETFDLESHQSNQRRCRPLYLQPQPGTFAAVDSILITNSLYLIQSAIGREHTHDVPTLLRIVNRLQAIGIEVDSPPLQLVYCLLGTLEDRVRGLLEAAHNTLNETQHTEVAALSREAFGRLSRLRVQGVVFDTLDNKLVVVDGTTTPRKRNSAMEKRREAELEAAVGAVEAEEAEAEEAEAEDDQEETNVRRTSPRKRRKRQRA
ncbi:hypothetical protein B0H12DRAFT_1221452 [Mycena haematopus]|nr:hypothetical protein B0H12DRAFT_1221452 [Mycena haematopus]